MRENNNRGPLTGRAMALRPIREAAVFLLVLAALLLTPGKRAGADVSGRRTILFTTSITKTAITRDAVITPMAPTDM